MEIAKIVVGPTAGAFEEAMLSLFDGFVRKWRDRGKNDGKNIFDITRGANDLGAVKTNRIARIDKQGLPTYCNCRVASIKRIWLPYSYSYVSELQTVSIEGLPRVLRLPGCECCLSYTIPLTYYFMLYSQLPSENCR